MTLTWAVAVTATLLALLVLNYVPPLLVRYVHARRLAHRVRGRLALTFDDGPDELVTPALLELLAAEGVPATFYLIGFRAEAAPEACDRLVEAGHELGCHTYRHTNYWKLPPWTAIADLRRAYRVLATWVERRATFRPAFGKLTSPALLWLWLTGKRVVWWTHVGGDWRAPIPDPGSVADGILASGGAVVLLHSWHKSTDRKEFVLALVRALIEGARDRGFELSTVSQLYGAARPAHR